MPVLRRVISARRRGPLRVGSWAMTAAIVSGVSGCAPGAAGLVSGDVLTADGARVIVVRGYGVQVRGEPVDAGITLGYARRTYVYPDTTSDLPDPGRYHFWVPQPPTPPVAWDGRAIGLDLRVSGPEVGLTLGFRGTSVLAWVPAGDTVLYRLRFMPDQPASTRLRYCEGRRRMRDDRTIRRRGLGLILGLCPLTLACCQWGQQLYVAHDTRLGIDASVNTATSSGSIELGYDRRFVTWVPRSVKVADSDDENAKEVMSVLACSELRVGIISLDYYDESLATGRAARTFAAALADPNKPNSQEVANDYFECFTKNAPKPGDGGNQ